MKGSKATEKMAEDWERGLFNIKSHKKINLRKKFKQLRRLQRLLSLRFVIILEWGIENFIKKSVDVNIWYLT